MKNDKQAIAARAEFKVCQGRDAKSQLNSSPGTLVVICHVKKRQTMFTVSRIQDEDMANDLLAVRREMKEWKIETSALFGIM